MLRMAFNQESEAEKSAGEKALRAALTEIDDLLGFTGGIDVIEPVSASEWHKLQRARERLGQLNNIPALMADVIFQQGSICERLGESKEALAWYERGSMLFPGRVADFARGASWCAVQLGQLEEAIFFSKLAADHDLDDSSLQVNLAIVLFIGGHLDEAYMQIVRTYLRWPQFGPTNIETIIHQCLHEGTTPPSSYAEYLTIYEHAIAGEPDVAAINIRVRAAIKANSNLADLAVRAEDDELLLDAARVAWEVGRLNSVTLMKHLHIDNVRANKLHDALIAKGVAG